MEIFRKIVCLSLLGFLCIGAKYNCCYWADYDCGGGGEYETGKCEKFVGSGTALMCVLDGETGENYETKKREECYYFATSDAKFQPYPVDFVKKHGQTNCQSVEVECKYGKDGTIYL